MDLKLIVAMLGIAAVPVSAQAQQSSTAKLKVDAQNVIKINRDQALSRAIV